MTLIRSMQIGSRAYGLERPDSDYDRVEFFIEPTRNLLQIPESSRPLVSFQEIEGEFDVRRVEVGFLLENMIRKSSHNFTEMLFFRPDFTTPVGDELVEVAKKLIRIDGLLHTAKGYLASHKRHIEAGHDVEKHILGVWRTHLTAAQLIKGRDPTDIRPDVVRSYAQTAPAESLPWIIEELLIPGLETLSEENANVYPEPDIETANVWLMDIRRRYF